MKQEKHVLVVSPNFPPTNSPDHQRVRMSLTHLAEFQWRATVLAVQPRYVEAAEDRLLERSLPPDVSVSRVRALDQRFTRMVGLGNLGLRALPFVIRKGVRLANRERFDLVYFSTTMFSVMPAGRVWRRKLGLPYVLDIQDPWLSGYHENTPISERPPKYRFARNLNRLLEPWTMRKVSGLTVVSKAYADTLRSRYPWIAETDCLTLPFGASVMDTELAKSLRPSLPFTPGNGLLHGVYVGRAGRDMNLSLSALFGALRRGLAEVPNVFSKVRLHFIGTDYAPAEKAREWVIPIAAKFGVEALVTEQPTRVGYFDALATLNAADFLVVPGSDDPQYTASKVYPYILARKPLLAVFHEASSVVSVLRDTKAGDVVTFNERTESEALSAEVERAWAKMLQRIPFTPQTNWPAFEPFTAREMTHKLCSFFDRVVERDCSR